MKKTEEQRELDFNKAYKYLENNNYPEALKLYKKLANSIDDVWGVFSVYQLNCFSEKLRISDDELFQFVATVVNGLDYTSEYDSSNIIHEYWNDLAFSLGLMYWHGKGCTQSYQHSFECFRRCALLGNPAAMYNMGILYKTGDIGEQNLEAALYWMLKSYECGFTDAEEQINQLCENLNYPKSLKSNDKIFAEYWDFLPNEKEYVSLINKLLVEYNNGFLTRKKSIVLEKARLRLGLKNERCNELINLYRNN